MSSGETAHSERGPQELYNRRLEQLRTSQALDERGEKRLGFAKLAIAFATVAAAIVLLYYSRLLWLLPLPGGAFLYFAVAHERHLQAIRERGRCIIFYERAIARITGKWAGSGESGEAF